MKNIVIIIALFISCPAFAQWIFIGGSKGTNLYIDAATIQKTSEGYRAWSIYDQINGEPLRGSNVLSILSYNIYDCSARKALQLSASYFVNRMGLGELIETTPPQRDWMIIHPDSLAGTVMDSVCLKAKQR